MTNDERETINRQTMNKTIHKWLGHCIQWNPKAGPTIIHKNNDKCRDCGLNEPAHTTAYGIPAYHSWDGMRLLLEGLKGKDVGMTFTSTVYAIGWHVLLTRDVTDPFNDTDIGIGAADTLPLALVAATVKLIEGENDAK